MSAAHDYFGKGRAAAVEKRIAWLVEWNLKLATCTNEAERARLKAELRARLPKEKVNRGRPGKRKDGEPA